jgi:4,5-dihydroxyphthalate decarboxylase
VEQDYFRRTGIFPIMHVIVIKGRILDQHPWVARNLFKAFVQAKDLLNQQMQETAALRLMLPWLSAELEATRTLMGDDFWPYGIEANRITLTAATRYSHEQGLTPRQLTIEELFAPGMQEEYRI